MELYSIGQERLVGRETALCLSPRTGFEFSHLPSETELARAEELVLLNKSMANDYYERGETHSSLCSRRGR